MRYKNLILVDYDSKDIDKYIYDVRLCITQLKFVGYTFPTVMVKETGKGLHMYFDLDTDCNMIDNGRTVNLLECFLLSDPKKQCFSFVEGNDILFRSKSDGGEIKSMEKDAPEASEKLNKLLQEINKVEYTFETIRVATPKLNKKAQVITKVIEVN